MNVTLKTQLRPFARTNTQPTYVAPSEGTLGTKLKLRALRWDFDIAPGVKADPPRTVIALHGLGDSADTWRATVDAWPKHRRPAQIIAIDLPGHGGSAQLENAAYTIKAVADVVADAIDTLGLQDVTLIGHSLGARVALQLASTRRLCCRSLVLVDLGIEPNLQAKGGVCAHLDMLVNGAESADAFVAKVASHLPLSRPQIVEKCLFHRPNQDAPGVHGAFDPRAKVLLDEDADKRCALQLGALIMPTSLIRGQFSSVLTKDAAQRMYAFLKLESALDTIPACGHAIMLEQPERLAVVLADRV